MTRLHEKSPRNRRVEIRVPEAVKRALDHASALEGRSMSDFIVAAAYAQAKRTIEEHETLVLSPRASQAFIQALLHPPKPVSAARRAAKLWKRRMGQ